MRPRNFILSIVLLALGVLAGVWLSPRLAPHLRAPAHEDTVSPPAHDDAAHTWYTCGMHPEVIQDHPGDCPKCGMQLQPLAPDRAAAMGLVRDDPSVDDPPAPADRQIAYWRSPMVPGEIHADPGVDSMGHDLVPVYQDELAAGTIRIDPVTEQNMAVRVAEVVAGPLRRTVRTVGFVDYDETALATVTTKVDGWVEKLHVDQTGVQVHRGDPLFEIYSPTLFSAQEEYLSALRNRRLVEIPNLPRAQIDSEALVRDARMRLELFDVSEAQIRELERTGQLRKTLTVRAPFTGIVTEKNLVEGQMVKSGENLFRIADLSTVWVIGKVFENDLPFVALGQESFMTLSYVPGKTFRGRVTYVYPYLEEKTREIPVRMEFHNPGYELKPGMYATITLTGEVAAESVLVPDTAVINTGLRRVAFVAREPGRYELREVTVGARGEDGRLQVLSGLAPGELVVVSGQFLLDSESRLREAALKFTKPGLVDAAPPGESASAGETAASEGRLYYVCPMPEHVDVLYDRPGDCPLCGMDMVPVRRQAGHIEQTLADYWTCPMSEHAHVRADGPGKCPLCGMSLVPVARGDLSPEKKAVANDEGGHVHAP